MNDIFYWLEGLDDLSYYKVKDYITNLQQKYEELDNRYKNSCEEYQKLVELLTEENVKLKDDLLNYELQNTKLQEELVRLRVTFGKSVY